MKRLVLSAVLIVAACGGAKPITGSFELHTASLSWSSSDCHGTGGYSDIQVGMPVTVKDAAGKIIGTSAVALDQAGSSASVCRYTFSVPLNESSDFYSIEVGRRGALNYSADELEGRGWTVAFTLGSG